MLAASARRNFTPALVLLFVGFTGVALGALEDAAVGTGAATTGICEEPIELEPGLKTVHCTSPPIPMTPGQVCPKHVLSAAKRSS